MAAIEIPGDYWTPTPAGFSALVQPFDDAFRDVHRDTTDALNALGGSATADVEAGLAMMDGDADVIANAIGDEHTTLSLTPTADVLGHYNAADGLAGTTDTLRPPDSTPPVDIVNPGPPTDPDQPVDQTPPPQAPAAIRSSSTAPAIVMPTVAVPPAAPGVPGAGGSGAGGQGVLVTTGTPGAAAAVVSEAASAAIETAAVAAPRNTDDLPVTRGELLTLLNQLDFVINVQV